LLGDSDEDVFACAWRERRVLLTHDRDFLDDKRFPEHRNPGVIAVAGGSGDQYALGMSIATVMLIFDHAPRVWERSKIVVGADQEMVIRTRGRVYDDIDVMNIICATMYVNNSKKGECMNTTLWLRISAIISLLFTAGHFMGGLKNWSPMGDNPVLQSMRTVRFHIMGVDRSYLDFFMGLGHSLTVSLLLQSVLLWILGDVARTNASLARPMIAAFVVAVALTGVVAWRYILPVPAFFSLALCTALVSAFITARRQPLRAG